MRVYPIKHIQKGHNNGQINFIYVSCILKQLPFPQDFIINDEESLITCTQTDFSFQGDDTDEDNHTEPKN